jgi:hypothetical protein
VADLPAGTATFLFTDLEGSTRLLGQHPAAYRLAVARHLALLLPWRGERRVCAGVRVPSAIDRRGRPPAAERRRLLEFEQDIPQKHPSPPEPAGPVSPSTGAGLHFLPACASRGASATKSHSPRRRGGRRRGGEGVRYGQR